jgi:hypothetical protein
MNKEMREQINKVKNFEKFVNEGDSPQGYHPEHITKEGYLKVEVIDDTLNNGKNSLVKVRCMDKSNRECELLVFTSDLKFGDKVTSITNKF